MTSETTVTFRDAGTDDLPALRRIIATAFAGEPFAFGMFGESRVSRLVGMMDEYDDWPTAPDPIVFVADAAGVPVGVALATLPGACELCDTFDATAVPDATTAAQLEHEFQARCRGAHLSQDLPPHAHIATVAIDPFLQGAGVGRRMIDGLVRRLWDTGADCAVLECLTTREAFYRGSGFRRLVGFLDPGGPDLRAVLMRVDARSDKLAGEPT